MMIDAKDAASAILAAESVFLTDLVISSHFSNSPHEWTDSNIFLKFSCPSNSRFSIYGLNIPLDVHPRWLTDCASGIILWFKSSKSCKYSTKKAAFLSETEMSLSASFFISLELNNVLLFAITSRHPQPYSPVINVYQTLHWKNRMYASNVHSLVIIPT